MKKFSVLVLLVFVALCVYAKGPSVHRTRVNAMGIDSKMKWEKLEVGLQVGVGFHEGMQSPSEGVQRIYQNALQQFADVFPMMETFGAVVRYSFDYHWAVQLQGMRQRIYFKEEGAGYYYNAMWDLDVTAEYNFLPYGLRAHRPRGVKGLRIRPYPATPYVFMGVGVAMSNKYSPLRGMGSAVADWKPEDLLKMYPMINPVNNNLAASVYVPIGVGVKWRMGDFWQLKAACQYNLGIGKDPSGGTHNRGGHVVTSYDDMTVGVWNNVVLSIGVIYNFGQEPKRMLLM
jgi:hypothetical protein